MHIADIQLLFVARPFAFVPRANPRSENPEYQDIGLTDYRVYPTARWNSL